MHCPFVKTAVAQGPCQNFTFIMNSSPQDSSASTLLGEGGVDCKALPLDLHETNCTAQCACAFPELPNELVDAIFAFCDSKTLRSCSLLSRNYRHLAQDHLLQAVHVPVALHSYQQSPERFIDDLESDRLLARRVHTLTLSLSVNPSHPLHERADGYLSQSLLRIIFSKLPQLQEVVFRHTYVTPSEHRCDTSTSDTSTVPRTPSFTSFGG